MTTLRDQLDQIARLEQALNERKETQDLQE
jgi:hypothetical protein